MSKYAEQFRDPRWQRKRLEVMDRAGFSCQECGDGTKTLNVHHKFYRRGAAPWDYADHELICLCEDCHKGHHDHREAINQQLAGADLFEFPLIHALIVGYRGGLVTAAGIPENYATDTIFAGDECLQAYLCGQVANAFNDLGTDDVRAVLDLFNGLNPDGFREFIAAALAKRRKA